MILLQASTPGGGSITMIFYVLVFGIMYFFFMRPAQKRRKDQDAFENELVKGKEVVTTSGIIGRVNKIEENIVHLQIDQKTFVRVVKGAISKEMTAQLKTEKEEA
jgi:preprotein translocase subunit YajC